MRNILMPEFLKSFFEMDNIIKGLWSLLTALFIFLLGMYYNSTRQPSKVEVVNNTTQKDTMVIRIDERYPTTNEYLTKTLSQLSRDIRDMQNKTSRPIILSPIPTRPLSDFFNSSSPKPIKIPEIEFPMNIAEIQLDKFSPPSGTKGYSQYGLSSIVYVQMLTTKVRRDSLVSIIVEFLDPNILKKASPFIIDILRKDSDYAFTLLMSQQYKLVKGKNLIRLAADLPPGNYKLDIGFYVLDELKGEYPPKYYSRYDIEVLK